MNRSGELPAWLQTVLRLVWPSYTLLTSLLCLLAFFPYTYYALIKSPVYLWMPWFFRQHGHLYWLVLFAAIAGHYKRMKSPLLAAVSAGMIAMGIWVNLHPLSSILNHRDLVFGWSVTALAAALLLVVIDLFSCPMETRGTTRTSLNYAPLVFSAILIGTLSFLGPIIQQWRQTKTMAPHSADLARGFWSVFSHCILALLIVTLLNIIFAVSERTSRPRLTRVATVSGIFFIAGLYGLTRFLDSAFGFRGRAAILYSALLIGSLILHAISVSNSLSAGIALAQVVERQGQLAAKALPVAAIAGLATLAVLLPSSLTEWDWNGVFQWSFTIFLWCSLTFCLYVLARRDKVYSVPALCTVLVVTIITYKGVQFGEVLWGKSLGATDAEIAQAFEQYGARDTSFRIVHHLLGNAPVEPPCSDFCRILTQYTNIPDAYTGARIEFVSPLVPSSATHPNIFMIVVDSLRADYVGAYNAKADFTPNIDALAADGVVLPHAYTEYAGTYLSEPAIWAGALLLHAHYVRPFANVNALERLLTADGYHMIVSYDNVLPELLSQTDSLEKLDTDKKTWKELDFCPTVGQLEHRLDTRAENSSPVFFYAQPQNVHMFASNAEPNVRAAHWNREGFNPRTSLAVHQVDACLGDLFSYLKKRNLFDESVIIVTSDHGDALGELGRRAHSYVMYPEVMRVPLIIHLPKSMRGKFFYDPNRLTTLTDITPSLYYLLGHNPLNRGPLLGQPVFTSTREELSSYSRDFIFMASDEVPLYGLLDRGRYFYTTRAFPERASLFDLATDPGGEHDIINPESKMHYDLAVLDMLKAIGDFYGYKLGVDSLMASQRK